MWGNFADGIASAALWQVRKNGTEADARAAFATARALIAVAGVASAAGERPASPRAGPVERRHGVDRHQDLLCSTSRALASGLRPVGEEVTVDFEIDPEDDGYCPSCPFLEQGEHPELRRRTGWKALP